MADHPLKLLVDNKNINQLKRQVTEMRKNLPTYLEMTEILVKITKAKYDALVKEGFTKEEALELCKRIKV